jgi:hypothetical protein
MFCFTLQMKHLKQVAVQDYKFSRIAFTNAVCWSTKPVQEGVRQIKKAALKSAA